MPVPGAERHDDGDVPGRIALRLRRRTESDCQQAKARQARSATSQAIEVLPADFAVLSIRCSDRSSNKPLCDRYVSRNCRIKAGRNRRSGISYSAMQSEKEKVALTSIAVSAGLTVAKAVVGFLSGSLALLSEAAHSLIDFSPP